MLNTRMWYLFKILNSILVCVVWRTEVNLRVIWCHPPCFLIESFICLGPHCLHQAGFQRTLGIYRSPPSQETVTNTCHCAWLLGRFWGLNSRWGNHSIGWAVSTALIAVLLYEYLEVHLLVYHLVFLFLDFKNCCAIFCMYNDTTLCPHQQCMRARVTLHLSNTSHLDFGNSFHDNRGVLRSHGWKKNTSDSTCMPYGK